MKPTWDVQFVPNSDGWTITFRSAPQQNENYDFVVDLKGGECFFSAGTFDARRILDSFGSELVKAFKSLSGTANLETDYFTLTVTAEKTGSLRFAGSLVCYQFSQSPAGHVRVDFEQFFDPITIEYAVKKLGSVEIQDSQISRDVIQTPEGVCHETFNGQCCYICNHLSVDFAFFANRLCRGRSSVILYHGALEPTKICSVGRMVGSSVSVPIVT
jgi:hypothetical protein